MSTIGLLGIAFIALKLLGVITWSWWWVTAPFWGGIAIFAIASIIIFCIALVVSLLH
jgi:hypothetical protein